MATTRSFLLIPITLCFLLGLAAAEQGPLLVIHGIARCKGNFSRIISNAPMYLVINNATVPGGTGRTTSDGELLITVNLNSTEQLAALMINGSSNAFVVAPPHACGAPKLPPGKELAAPVRVTAIMFGQKNDDDAAGISVKGSFHATNNGDAVHLNALQLLHKQGDPSHLINGLGQVIVATIDRCLCVTITRIIG